MNASHREIPANEGRPVSRHLLCGPVIITRYLGWTDTRPERIIATHKRDNSTTWRHVHTWGAADDVAPGEDPVTAQHRAAAQALLNQWPYSNDLEIIGRGHDAEAYYWLVVGRWQLPAPALEANP